MRQPIRLSRPVCTPDAQDVSVRHSEDRCVESVADIEKSVNIYDLSQFTPT